MKAKLEIRRKTLVSALMVLFIVSIIPVGAQMTPTLDGVISPGEWGEVDFTGIGYGIYEGYEVYVQNDLDYLYVAFVDHLGADYAADGETRICVYPGDDYAGECWAYRLWGPKLLYYTTHHIQPPIVTEDEQPLPTTSVVAIKMNVMEWKIPLDEVSAKPGDTIAFDLYSVMGGFSSEETAWIYEVYYTLWAPNTVDLTATVQGDSAEVDLTVTVIAPSPPPSPRPNKKPKADAGPNMKISVGSTLYFNGEGSYDKDGWIISYNWDFGDDTTDTGETISHTYTVPGHYKVTLTVKDNRGAEDSDKCEVFVWKPPAPVASKFGQYVPGEQKGFKLDASEAANTIVTLDTTNNVTVTVLKYEDNPHPGDPIPAMALPTYVDVEVSDPDAVVWPIYVEISYTDEQAEGLDETTFGIYYWFNGTWQRCSDTGVDTERNVVWAYMTAEEASGSPILIAGMHAIPTPPVPPFLDNLTVTPSEIELGDNVTISIDIMNIDSQTYAVDMHIENVNDPPPTWPPMDVYLRIWVDLEDNESKTVSHTMTMDTVGDFNVTVHGMTGSFKVGTWPPEPPLKPAEFVVSGLMVSPTKVPTGDPVTVRVTVTNIGELTGTYTLDIKVDGDTPEGPPIETVLEGGASTMITFTLTEEPGEHTVKVDGLTSGFVVTAHPKPPEFEVSDLTITPEEVEPGDEVTISVLVTNIGEETGDYTVTLGMENIIAFMSEEEVTLEGGESERVEFEVSRDIEGTYDVTVDGLTGSFTVSKKPRPFWTQPGYVAGIVIIVASAGAVIYFAWKAKLFSNIFSGSS